MNTVPAGRGWNWVLTGFALFRKSPGMWAFSVFTYFLLMQLIGMIPKLGLILVLVLVPVFSASFMIFCREVDTGHRPGFGLLFSGFRTNLPALLRQGGIYLASVLIILALSALADGGVLLKIIVWDDAPPVAKLEQGNFIGALALIATLYIPVFASFWFAPALSAWRGLSALQALFYSFFATLRNWRAFVVYGISLLLISVLLGQVLVRLTPLSQELSGGGSQNAIVLVHLLVMLTYVPTLFASFYASYRDVFPEPEAGPEAAADAQ